MQCHVLWFEVDFTPLTDPENTQRNKHVIITSKRRFDIIIVYYIVL